MTAKDNRLRALWRSLQIGAVSLAAAFALTAIAPELAYAQEAPAAVEAVAAPEAAVVAEVVEEAAVEPTMDKGDVAWMMVSTILVVFMIIPGLGLFYGGLSRAKNMLSVLMQVSTVAVIGMLCWALWGYSLSFTDTELFGNQFIGSLDRLFLAGITADSTAATFSDGVVIPEFVFISFQMTFAAITAALVVGGFAERMRFSAVVVFAVLWPLLSYYPIAHMVWWAGGFLFEMGALDFAGGTVVHINAGVAGLIGAIFVGHRLGYKSEPLPPHSLVMTFIGAGMLWVGWFGFNAGSNLEATAGAGVAIITTLLATAAAGVSWIVTEWVTRGKPSMLGLASGIVAGLVVVTPAAGLVGPMGAIILGLIASPIAVFFCAAVKKMLNYDDAYDVFGIHAVCGIIGAIGTGVFYDPALGGLGGEDFNMVSQVTTQAVAVGVSIAWSAIATIIVFLILKVIGLRVKKEVEQEGLDINEHGEAAYHL
ncbi:ammonium transporter [Vitreimonas sp.]|uniref:ammonium transporter n=1 Tax=Vitreimonas sp. TaxID=3069702 RepID=UPI002ED9A38D